MTRPLRIAVLVANYTRIGGAERYCVELTERLTTEHEVHVFCQTISTSQHPNIQFHSIAKPFSKFRFLNNLIFSRLTRLATANNFDIVHSHAMVTHANVQTLHVPCVLSRYTGISGVKKGLRYLNTLLSPRLLTYLWLEKQQICTKNNRQIIAVSEFLAANIMRSYPKIHNNINIAYPGIEITHSLKTQSKSRTQYRNQLQLSDDDFVLLFVANDYRRKGLLVLLQSLQTLANSKLHLIVAGDDQAEKFTEAVAISGLTQQVHFIGTCTDMHGLYPAGDALIHPTLADTYAMVVLEAMAHALPVIVSDTTYCGISEHLNENEALLIRQPTDSTEIATHINKLFSNPELCQLLAHKGREKALTITWDNTLMQTLSAFTKALETTKTGST